ncbi:hypothetical protein [Actinokineospora pegani]|uniref:hypothetical protein n=1 Tax=Actinokineospora pegani TaxID=2654637 RepID=UPI0012E9D456|nr:hypothetical protein [Actinokineospora pegani]
MGKTGVVGVIMLAVGAVVALAAAVLPVLQPALWGGAATESGLVTFTSAAVAVIGLVLVGLDRFHS